MIVTVTVTKKMYEEWLNEEWKSDDKNWKYGSWLRFNKPMNFQRGYLAFVNMKLREVLK